MELSNFYKSLQCIFGDTWCDRPTDRQRNYFDTKEEIQENNIFKNVIKLENNASEDKLFVLISWVNIKHHNILYTCIYGSMCIERDCFNSYIRTALIDVIAYFEIHSNFVPWPRWLGATKSKSTKSFNESYESQLSKMLTFKLLQLLQWYRMTIDLFYRHVRSFVKWFKKSSAFFLTKARIQFPKNPNCQFFIFGVKSSCNYAIHQCKYFCFVFILYITPFSLGGLKKMAAPNRDSHYSCRELKIGNPGCVCPICC